MYKWNREHGYKENEKVKENPYGYDAIERIKSEFEADEKAAREKYPEILYYFDGLEGTKVSQSVHPAGMVISPITLRDNFGCFDKDGETCLMLDMENVHEYTGLAKYDFLVLKTVQVIRDACKYMGQQYPRSHEIDWNDENVWRDMIKSPSGIFQFEGAFAFESLKKFVPKSLFDMSIVTACIRPSGTSYRDDLLSRKPHKNPSEIIDELLSENLGYLIYQEDTIKFLQEICGLSGSEADNIRRAIGRKQKDRLDAAMPSILEGYCNKSPKPKEEAELEAKEFLQIIEDSASYQFGRNHSIAYCMLGYLCAYYRYYHPLEFITSFLNNAKNEDDIRNGSAYAEKVGIKITMPKWGISKGDYSYDTEKRTIARGMSSIKYIGESVACELFDLSKEKDYTNFVDVLFDIDEKTSVNTRQLDILIKIDFFSEFGNQRELLRITDVFYNQFKKGQAKQISRSIVDGTELEPIVQKYAVGVTKSGGVAKNYTLLDTKSLIKDIWAAIKAANVPDLNVKLKVKNFADVMGYVGYTSGREEDRRLLYVTAIYPVVRKKDNKQFGYSITTKSIGSGKDGRFTVFNREYNNEPFTKGDIIYCTEFTRNGQYFNLTGFKKVY